MKDCIKEYLLDIHIKGFAESTIKNKRNALTHFANWCCKEIEDIRPVHIKEYIQDELNKGVQTVSVNFRLKQLKAFFAYCIEERLINKNPMEKIKLLQQEKTMIRTYSDEDIKALINYYNGKTYLQVRNKTIIMILVETGIRNSELRNIKLEDVYDDVIRVSGKGKTRHVPISNHLKKQLIKYMRARKTYERAQECPYLIVSTGGRRVSLEVPLEVLKRAGKAANIDVKLHVHSLGRYYAQTMLGNDVDLYTVSRLLGHSNITTTQIYVQSTEDKVIMQRGMKSPLSKI
jgi:integrase/recombinase XerD